MFNEIGKKIKRYVSTACKASIGIIVGLSIIGVLTSDFSGDSKSSALLNTIAWLLFGVLGSLACWIGSFLVYGFGELIDKVCDIERHLSLVRGGSPKISRKVIDGVTNTIEELAPKKTIKYNTQDWICPSCGVSNIYYYEECECGAKKPGT